MLAFVYIYAGHRLGIIIIIAFLIVVEWKKFLLSYFE